jgi:hypothetical protein
MTAERVVTLRRPRAAPKPTPPAYAQVTAEARACADTLERRATTIRRLLGQNFATTASVAAIPSLLREAKAALAELEELTQ